MMPDIFDPLLELQDQRMMKLGNPLLELERSINWELFRPLLKRIHHKTRKSNAGAKPKDVVMMFKGVMIQDLYGLSDDQLEFQLADRRSFQQFLDLSNHQRPPDAKTFWSFKNQLSELALTDSLFKEFSKQLEQAGYIARKGQIVDASIIPAPIQRNTREENKQIKESGIPEDWSDNKGCQKHTDARWTKKNNTNYYGYKNHIQIDNDRKLIRNYSVTPANVHDSQVFEELLDDSNTSKDVWADSVYRSEEQEASLKDKGYRSKK